MVWHNAIQPAPAFGGRPGGGVLLTNLNNGAGIGKFHLHTAIFLGGRADLNTARFYTGAIAGLQIYTEGLGASDVACIYNAQELLILGTTAHSCTVRACVRSWCSAGHPCLARPVCCSYRRLLPPPKPGD
eukprot:SAG22_NODE_6084_length_902_cov_0.948941_2_plen_130_part_00